MFSRMHAKKQESMPVCVCVVCVHTRMLSVTSDSHTQEQNRSIKVFCEGASMLNLEEKDIKTDIINMLQKLKN